MGLTNEFGQAAPQVAKGAKLVSAHRSIWAAAVRHLAGSLRQQGLLQCKPCSSNLRWTKRGIAVRPTWLRHASTLAPEETWRVTPSGPHACLPRTAAQGIQELAGWLPRQFLHLTTRNAQRRSFERGSPSTGQTISARQTKWTTGVPSSIPGVPKMSLASQKFGGSKERVSDSWHNRMVPWIQVPSDSS